MGRHIGKYEIISTLGRGASAKVKLAINTETGERVALKIFPRKKLIDTLSKAQAEISAQPIFAFLFLHLPTTVSLCPCFSSTYHGFIVFSLTLSLHVDMMMKVSHENIIALKEVIWDACYPKKKGGCEQVITMVMEVATNGELFEFMQFTGAFSEDVVRFYFKQLLSAVLAMHQAGVAHRDLKPENVLLDSEFRLKIADLGLASLLAGRDGSGLCRTRLGTESYMAPEVLSNKAYDGAAADCWALAVVLFIMVAGVPPFASASPRDPWFSRVIAGRWDQFWEVHRSAAPGRFSPEIQALFQKLFHPDPRLRLSLSQLQEDSWVCGPVPCSKLVYDELKRRRQEVERAKERQRQERERKRSRQMAYRGVGRGNYLPPHCMSQCHGQVNVNASAQVLAAASAHTANANNATANVNVNANFNVNVHVNVNVNASKNPSLPMPSMSPSNSISPTLVSSPSNSPSSANSPSSSPSSAVNVNVNASASHNSVPSLSPTVSFSGLRLRTSPSMR